MATFYDYLWALWGNWTWLMTGGPFLAERIAKQFWAGYDAWAAVYLPIALRRRVLPFLAALGVFVAGFLAFKTEKQEVDRLTKSISEIRSPQYIPYGVLSADKLARLTQAFEGMINPPLVIVAFTSDASAVRIAEQIHRAIKKAIPNSEKVAGAVDDKSPNEQGVLLLFVDHETPGPAMKDCIERFSKSGIPFTVGKWEPDTQQPQDRAFVIFVGPRGSLGF